MKDSEEQILGPPNFLRHLLLSHCRFPINIEKLNKSQRQILGNNKSDMIPIPNKPD